jgi:hypothetical protein
LKIRNKLLTACKEPLDRKKIQEKGGTRGANGRREGKEEIGGTVIRNKRQIFLRIDAINREGGNGERSKMRRGGRWGWREE